MTDPFVRAVEAVLFASETPLTPGMIAAYVGEGDVRRALAVIEADHAGRGFGLVRRGEHWHFETAPDLAHFLRRDRVESIRGVQISKGTIDVLLAAGWLRPAGRREVPGRPLTYATTQGFLDHFGLNSRRDLPGIDDLRAAGLLDPIDNACASVLESGDDSD